MASEDSREELAESGEGSVLFLTPVSPTTPPPRFWFRLYWFPLKVLYATCHCSLQSVPDIPYYFFFNILLLLLMVMNIYWFLVSPGHLQAWEGPVCRCKGPVAATGFHWCPFPPAVHCGFRSQGADWSDA